MRIKKGFTLAEILIVLMVIGVIATMTIPSLMKGVQEAQYKAGYKKAYNNLVNLVAKENLAGNIAKKRSADLTTRFFGIMADNLEVRQFVVSNDIDSGIVLLAGDSNIKTGLKLHSSGADIHVGLTTDDSEGIAPGNNTLSSWMIVDDGLAYALFVPGADSNDDCPLKAEILTKNSAAEALENSCMVVVVDVNGLYKGPNRLERQITSSGSSTVPADSVVDSTTKMATLTRDRYYIYIGADGATAGPTATTISGRIINDLK